MIEFAKQVSEKWNLSAPLSELICEAFQKGDTPYYLAEYRPEVAVELPIAVLWEIFDYLKGMEELDSKKKRVLNALKKANQLTSSIENRVNNSADAFDLDDMLLPLRPNPRSRGQLAAKKGLEPLADLIARQEEQSLPIEELAEPYIGKDPSLKTTADVMQGVKDVLAERLAYDETIRSMVRDFAYEDGYFEVIPKNKQDPRFSRYAGKDLLLPELTKEEILTLLAAEEEKTIRCRLGVQLFRITELLRHHFIQNPDFSGFDLLCEIIDDSWQRLLQPIIERDVKIRLQQEAWEWIAARMVPEIEKRYSGEESRGALCIVDASPVKQMLFLVVNGHGDLLGATSEKRSPDGAIVSCDRIRQFFLRHHPEEIIVCDNEQADAAEAALAKIIGEPAEGEAVPPISRNKPDADDRNPCESEWVLKKFETLLDADMRKLYGFALMFLKPIRLIPSIGVDFYSVHPLQRAVQRDRFLAIIDRILTDSALHKGVAVRDIVDSPIAKLSCASAEVLGNVRAADALEPLTAKDALLKVEGMTEVIFRNIAGFVMMPASEDIRDRSLVHPDHYSWLEEAGEQISVSLDTIMSDPEILRSFATEDFIRKIYLEKKLIPQLRASIRPAGPSLQKSKRKLKLAELKEGSIVSGKVTNITPFGVFININAVCDGLVHISQLADEYVESPDQVVALHDKVDVRILKVDAKKRRISLSMKNLGKRAPRVRPSTGQLHTLAEHFKNR
jgi:uncharacterized protein